MAAPAAGTATYALTGRGISRGFCRVLTFAQVAGFGPQAASVEAHVKCHGIWWLLAVAGAGCWPFAALGQTPAPVTKLAWDCWIAMGKVVSIRCIGAREGMEPADPALDSREAVVLDHVHNLIHNGKGIEIDGVVLANIDVVRQGSIWNIRLWNYPHESSWIEDRPARIVRAALCPAGTACEVFVSRR